MLDGARGAGSHETGKQAMIRPLRLRRPQADTVRSIRYWAIELTVVVVGVLLALFLAQWAQDRREARQMALAEEAIREELRMNLATVQIHNSADGCQIEMIDKLFARLDAPQNRWEGIEEHTTRKVSVGAGRERSFYPLPLYEIKSQAWDSANRDGLFDRMDRALFEQYLLAYDIFRVADEQIKRERVVREDLAWLMYPTVLTEEMRSEARGLLRNLETTRDVRSRMDMATQTLRDLQIGPSPAMDAVIDGWPDLNTNGNPAILRTCFVAPENPLRVRNE